MSLGMAGTRLPCDGNTTFSVWNRMAIVKRHARIIPTRLENDRLVSIILANCVNAAGIFVSLSALEP